MATVSAVHPESGQQEVALWDFRQLGRPEPMTPIVLGVVPPGKGRSSFIGNVHQKNVLIVRWCCFDCGANRVLRCIWNCSVASSRHLVLL